MELTYFGKKALSVFPPNTHDLIKGLDSTLHTIASDVSLLSQKKEALKSYIRGLVDTVVTEDNQSLDDLLLIKIMLNNCIGSHGLDLTSEQFKHFVYLFNTLNETIEDIVVSRTTNKGVSLC